VNNYRSNPNAWRAETGKSGTAELWSSFTQFASRQPELVIAGALIGGAVLGFLIKGAATQATPRYLERGPERSAPARRGAYRREEALAGRMPSKRLGATEDQMSATFPTPSSQALEAGSGGTTGAIYDLDPGSLTSG